MLPYMSNPSVMQHSFSKAPQADIPRSSFRRSHGYKTTMDSGYLYPIFVDECLPGDSFNVKMSTIARLATPQVPIMDNMFMDFFFFFVPNRLIWTNWQRFMGEQTDPGDSTDYLVPTVTADGGVGFQVGSLHDYFGLPTGVNSLTVNSLHHRAYNLCWNEWFRDENLQDSVNVPVDDGPDTVGDFVLLKRGKRHDYFTSCLPWPQKGDQIDLPLGETAPVVGDGVNGMSLWNQGGGVASLQFTTGAAVNTNPNYNNLDTININANPAQTTVFADLSNATAASINSLREAFQLQRMLERDARGGTRYTEVILSHFGVSSPDARLQRPEYLGGGSTPITVNPVAQTSDTAISGTPQGNLAAVGFQHSEGIGFTKSFVEHGVIIGLCNVRADLTYQTGVDRMWSRQTKYDFYWPALAHLGEQEVLNKEIFAQQTAVDNEVFGYQERFAEYRYAQSKITGQFRSSYATSLDYWHLSQDFASLPTLNSDFIEENPPIDRVIAVQDEPQFVFDSYFDVVCTRPMPTYSVPGLIDHF